MFRTLARLLNDPTLTSPTAQPSEQIFLIHPLQLSRWLEQAWTFANNLTWAGLPNNPPFLGDPGIITALRLPDAPTSLLNGPLASGISTNAADYTPPTDPSAYYPPQAAGSIVAAGLPWDHLIYALLIENTGVFEILAEVIRRYAVGETLEAPSLETLRWLRTTEELFFRNPPLFHITGITSEIRPNMRISRRNAYWRMFGMDCAHPLPPQYGSATNDQAWKRDVGAANERFHETSCSCVSRYGSGSRTSPTAVGQTPPIRPTSVN